MIKMVDTDKEHIERGVQELNEWKQDRRHLGKIFSIGVEKYRGTYELQFLMGSIGNVNTIELQKQLDEVTKEIDYRVGQLRVFVPMHDERTDYLAFWVILDKVEKDDED